MGSFLNFARGSDVLISAAVGNQGVELLDETIRKDGILPASLYPKICKSKGTEPILRVGATNEYETSIEPKLYMSRHTGSNYGKKYVDILAPGGNIPILSPGDLASFGGGTSEAAAIITATVALMISCKPYASAKQIREAILENADHYVNLESKVANGNVLNITKIIQSFCFYHEENTNAATANETRSFEIVV